MPVKRPRSAQVMRGARHKPWRSSGGDLCGGSRGEIGDKMMILCIDEIGYNKMI